MRLIRATDWFINGATGVLVMCAVVVTSLRVREALANRAATDQTPDRPPPSSVANWRTFSMHGDRMGSAKAAVTIVEFADFQCPFCRRAAPELRALRQRFPGDLAVVYRHYPGHEFSFSAAVASECAARFGAFEAFHDALYAQPESIGRRPWSVVASQSGVKDTVRFTHCLADPTVANEVVRDTVDAARLRVRGTPTFLINDVMITGYRQAQLDSIVNTMLARAKVDQ